MPQSDLIDFIEKKVSSLALSFMIRYVNAEVFLKLENSSDKENKISRD